MKKTQVALAAFAVILAILFASSSARADTYTYSYISQGATRSRRLAPVFTLPDANLIHGGKRTRSEYCLYVDRGRLWHRESA